ncbi:XDH1 [Scenedesmus sp. PABB004]|nr:XDH1 [Scenedesmus sp. PABB004]
MAGGGAAPIAYVNGVRHELPLGRGEATLLQWLRETGLTGTKLGCGEGGCGACTVMLSHWEGGRPVHRAVNACLCPLYAVEGMHVVTVEGIGSVRGGLHPVQAALAGSHGSQCGFCTPGFVMSMYALLRARAADGAGAPSEEEIEECLAGNLCRCTGYRPILDAFKVFAKAEPAAYTAEAIAAARGMAAASAADAACGAPPANGAHAANGAPAANGARLVCPSSGAPCDCGGGVAAGGAPAAGGCGAGGCGAGDCGAGGCGAGAGAKVKPSAEPIFPRELKTRVPAALTLEGPLCTWHRPTCLEELLVIKTAHPDVKLVGGNSEVGIEMKFKDAGYRHLAAITHVPELAAVCVTEAGLEVGAGVTLSRLQDLLLAQVAGQPAHRTRGFAAAAEQLRWFAGRQIRNVGTLGGNIATASPISDLNPLWMAFGATFVLAGARGARREVPATNFFLAYRKVDMAPTELLLAVRIPFTRPGEFAKEYKQAPRRDDDIAIVNAGMRVLLEQRGAAGWVVAEAGIAYGGVAPKTIMAAKTMAALVGKPWCQATLDGALDALRGDVSVPATAPGGRGEYRNSLSASFLFKFYVHVCLEMAAAHPDSFDPQLPPDYASAAQPYHRPPVRGVQLHHPVPAACDGSAEVGKDYRHMSADLQVSGQAQYTDDVPLPPNTLHAALVTSTRPHARLLSVDHSAALAVPGVVGYFSAGDVPGDNAIGPVMRDELVFATDTVTCVGQVIGVVVAESEPAARRGAKAVAVEYEDLPAVISIEDAIAAGSFYEAYGNSLATGDLDAGFAAADHVLEGTIRLGGQEHFYLEPNACVVLPAEDDEFTLFASTQAPNKHQVFVASALGLPMHKVVCKTKRIGGGFGGKETRSIFLHCAAAVPAFHTRRPVKLVLDRDEDMQMTGTRHPFLATYRVGFTADGAVTALDVHLYNNAGNSWDLSSAVMDRALMHADCVYKFPAQRVTGHMARTNIASNTAFRGFGGPQGLMVAETVMERVAAHLGRDSVAMRAPALYVDGDVTHFGMVIENSQVVACWDAVQRQAGGWAARRAEVDAFNAQHRWRKRGLALTPTKFGIAFTKLTYNQGGALVHVYTDGTVLVTHGGVEMGQGLHTKMAQVAAHELGVPVSCVFIAETATDKVPNASPTAGSASTDLYGMAVLDACRQIKARLEPYRAKAAAEGWSFAQLATAAYVDRVDLSAHGFYATPDVTGFGGPRPFNYFVFGAAVSEVELDTLTGDWQLRRSDVVMDIGNPINPAIDIGQIEGGFVQGMGWLCMEEMIWGDKAHPWVRPGHLFTKGPGTYKIPTANDIPVDFRVSLLQGTPNARAVHSSKAIGEPPFHLGAAVFFALKDAVYAARAAAGVTGWFPFDAPATPERLRMACAGMSEPQGRGEQQPRPAGGGGSSSSSSSSSGSSDSGDGVGAGQRAAFQAAADHLGALVSANASAVPDAVKLQLYGLYKQALAGDCAAPKPPLWDRAGRAKWGAWRGAAGLPPGAAMARYVELLREHDPGWAPPAAPAPGRGGGAAARQGGVGGPVFSTLARREDEEAPPDGVAATLHELAGGAEPAALAARLQLQAGGGGGVDARDEQGCTALHFAADRGRVDAVRLLLAAGADANAQDHDGQAPLHYAAMCGHEAACRLLLELGADAGLVDAEGQTARQLGPAAWSWWA